MPHSHLNLKPGNSRQVLVFITTLLLGMALTFYFYSHRIESERTKEHDKLALEAKDYQHQLQKWLDTFLSLNKGLAAFFSASDHVNKREFNDYILTAQPFEQLKGLGSLGYLQQVPSDQITAFEAQEQADYPGFRLQTSPAQLPYHYPLIHTVSATHGDSRHEAKQGLDYAQIPHYADAINRALETGTNSATAPYRVEINGIPQQVIAVFTPVYQPDLLQASTTDAHRIIKGLVYSTLTLDQFISGFQEYRFSQSFGVRFYLEHAAPENLVYQDAELADGKTRRLQLIQTDRLYFAGNRYVIEFYEDRPEPVLHILRAGMGILGIGLVVSLLLAYSAWRFYRHLGALAGSSALAEQFTSFFKNHPFSVCSLDRQRRFVAVNPQMAAELGLDASELTGRPIDHFLANAPAETRKIFTQAINGQTMSFQGRIRRPDHTEYDFAIVLIPLQSHGVVGSILCIAENITERKRLEEKLFHQANYDALTGLPNRAYFYAQLKQAMARHQRKPGSMALMYLDIDEFKNINDTYGHSIGDQVIRMFARRVSSTIRSSDLLARVGGDEFVLLVEDHADTLALETVALKIIQLLEPSFAIQDKTIKVRTSIGIACLRPDMSPDDLVREADHAMYTAKRTGRNRYHIAQECRNNDIRISA